MNGKILRDSTSIYQDQARILFEYYRRAAEQIVTEEMRLEQEISAGEATLAQTQKQISGLKPRIIGGLGGGTALLLLCFVNVVLGILLAVAAAVFGVISYFQSNALVKKLAEAGDAISRSRTAHEQIRRQYKVAKLAIAYVPIARQIPFEGRSFLIDLTDSTPKQEFRLASVRRGELFTSTISELEGLLREAPMVETSEEMEEVQTDRYSRSIQKVSYYDYIGSLDRKLRTATFCLEDLDTSSVELPTIPPSSETANYIRTHSTDDPAGFPVLRPFAVERFDAELETFRELNEMKKSLERHSAQFEEVLRGLMLRIARAVQSLSRLKVASTGRLVEESNRLLFTILKAGYNHYSPVLEGEEIERIRAESFDYRESVENYRPFQLKKSSRVLYDPLSGMWVAEDGSRTAAPFGISQIHEEIVAPIVQNLMAETRIERLKIYNGIRDQKINYLNQWHQDTEDFYGRNRAESSDLINLMRGTFSEFIASYNALSALEKTEQNMSASGSLEDAITQSSGDATEVVASYELKSREFQTAQDEFAEYMERLKEDIDRRAAKFGFIEYYDASLRDGSARHVAQAASQAGSLDERRKPLAAVDPWFAAVSELPPPPSVEPEAYEALSINLETVAQEGTPQFAEAVAVGRH